MKDSPARYRRHVFDSTAPLDDRYCRCGAITWTKQYSRWVKAGSPYFEDQRDTCEPEVP